MGYSGKLREQARARELRADSWTLQQIAEELGVAKSSASLWVRDVEFTPRSHNGARPRRRGPNKLQRRKQAEIETLLAAGKSRIGELSDRDLLIAGVALYAGEGSKTDGCVDFANTNPAMILLFCVWLRKFFEISEERLRARLYLHQNLDLQAATGYWSRLTAIPQEQFVRPYRAEPDQTRRRSKHATGCLTVRYRCSRTHREIMGLVQGLLAAVDARLPAPDSAADRDTISGDAGC